LRYLMLEHALAEADLPEVGPHTLVSEILRGKKGDGFIFTHGLALLINPASSLFGSVGASAAQSTGAGAGLCGLRSRSYTLLAALMYNAGRSYLGDTT
jgi:hypothetical protein